MHLALKEFTKRKVNNTKNTKRKRIINQYTLIKLEILFSSSNSDYLQHVSM